MALPLPWVNRIFAKLTVAYGRDFLNRWEGIDLALVQADWAEELDGYLKNPDALVYGLNNLPADKPPTAKQFRAICNNRPEPKLTALAAPVGQPSPEVRAKVAQLIHPASQQHPKDWARKLRDREQQTGGRGMTRAQREMWRTALADEVAEAA